MARAPRPPRVTPITKSSAVKRGVKARQDAADEMLEAFDEDYDGEPEVRAGRVPPGGGRRGAGGDKRLQRKVTLGQRWSQIVNEVEAGEYTWDDFARTLSADELVRGHLKDKNGRFTGPPPKLLPRAFLLQCQREIKRRFDEKMQDRLLEATDELIALSKANGGLQAKDRAKLLQYLIERVMGPVPKVVSVSAEKPWEDLVVGVMGEAPSGMKAPLEEEPEEGEEDYED